MNKPRFSARFRQACLVVVRHVHGTKGDWAYESFSFINRRYYADRLPWAYIVWGLTEHGSCTAWSSTAIDKSRPPIITLHPSLLGGSEKPDPWRINPRWLGDSLAFDALLHECIHVHIGYNLGGPRGRSSHDCMRWVRQLNRLAPLLGFEGIKAGRTKTMRVPDHSAPRTVRGKSPTKVVRCTSGNVPFFAVYGFPRALRQHLEEADDYYRHGRLPADAPKLVET